MLIIRPMWDRLCKLWVFIWLNPWKLRVWWNLEKLSKYKNALSNITAQRQNLKKRLLNRFYGKLEFCIYTLIKLSWQFNCKDVFHSCLDYPTFSHFEPKTRRTHEARINATIVVYLLILSYWEIRTYMYQYYRIKCKLG